MKQPKVDTLIRRWFDDAQFRSAMRTNPLAAAEEAGFALDANERNALAAMDWSCSDEQLRTRINPLTC